MTWAETVGTIARLGYKPAEDNVSPTFTLFVKHHADDLTEKAVTLWLRAFPREGVCQLTSEINAFTIRSELIHIDEATFQKEHEQPLLAVLHTFEAVRDDRTNP